MTTPTTTPAEPKMTAKIALSNLAGDLAIARGNLIQSKRAGGHPSYIAQMDKNVAVLEYAIAALRAFKLTGKSATKAVQLLKDGEELTLRVRASAAPGSDDDSGDDDDASY